MRDQPDADLHLTKHNTRKRQISMSPAVFETTILGSKRPQTHALDRAATGIGNFFLNEHKLWIKIFLHTISNLITKLNGRSLFTLRMRDGPITYIAKI